MRSLLLIAVMAAMAAPAAAQGRPVKDDLENIVNDAWFIVKSPIRASGDDWQTTGLMAGGFGVLLLLDEPVDAWLRANPESLPVKLLEPFGESSPVNLLGRTKQFLVPLSVVFYASGHAFDSDDLKDAGLGCLTSNVTTTLTRSAVSLLLGRLRPLGDRGAFVIEPLAFGDWDMRSFPGGHAANVMSCASFFNNRFDLGVAEPAIYAAAAGVGLARVKDRAHWISDTFAGMAYGYSVGRGVAGRFSERAADREQTVQPQLHLGFRITF